MICSKYFNFEGDFMIEITNTLKMKQSIFYLLLVLVAILIMSSCSKKPIEIEEVETSTQKFYYGGIFSPCDADPQIFMNIDVLKKYCNRNNRLEDLLDMDSINFTSFMPCHPFSIRTESDSDSTNNEINWDFKISMGSEGYQVEWRETPLSIKPIEVEIGFQERGKFPFWHFYKGYEVQTSEVQTVTVLFFNSWVGGCIHDYYVWELVES